MPLQVLIDEEHWVLKARIADAAYPTKDWEVAHTYNDITENPSNHAPDVWLDVDTGAMFHPSETPNPYLYKEEKAKVIKWARDSINNHDFINYMNHGHALTAKVFHGFAVMNVLAAFHPVNILGPHWHLVQGNLANWRDFVQFINVQEWNRIGDGVRYFHLADGTGGFVIFVDGGPVRKEGIITVSPTANRKDFLRAVFDVISLNFH